MLQLSFLNPAPPAMSLAGRFASASSVLDFIHAGNATLTIRSRKTQTRYTYKVRKAAKPLPNAPWRTTWFVNLLRGSDNESDFAYLGTIKMDNRSAAVLHAGLGKYATCKYAHGGVSRIAATAPSAQAFIWLYRNLQKGTLPDSVEIWHEGRCGRCGRKLTVPESIERGIGPECAERGGVL
jgi:hypothetical protein